MCKPKLFFCILVCVDSINVEISMNANDQCRLYKVKVLQTEWITVLAMGQTTRVVLVKASKNKANLATDEVRVESQNHGLA